MNECLENRRQERRKEKEYERAGREKQKQRQTLEKNMQGCKKIERSAEFRVSCFLDFGKFARTAQSFQEVVFSVSSEFLCLFYSVVSCLARGSLFACSFMNRAEELAALLSAQRQELQNPSGLNYSIAPSSPILILAPVVSR